MFRERFLPAGDLSIRLCFSGHGKTNLLFVHGNCGSAEDWALQLNDPEMQEVFTMAAIDLPGNGQSGRTDDYLLKTLAERLVGIVNELKWTRFVLAGLSYGSAIIAEAAPALKGCTGFAMLAPNVTSDAHLPGSYLVTVPGFECLFSETFDAERLRGFSEALALRPDGAEVEEFIENWHRTDGQFRVAIATASAEKAWSDEVENLRRTGVPCLFIFGAEDRVIRPDYLDNELSYPLFNKVILPEAAHFINKNQPQLVNRLLMQRFSNP